MKKDNILQICFIISFFTHAIFFFSILIKDTTSLSKNITRSREKKIKESQDLLIEIERYNAPPKKLYNASILSLSCKKTTKNNLPTISPYIQSVWDNTYDDIKIKKAIPTQFTETQNLAVAPRKRIFILNKKIKPDADILSFKTPVNIISSEKSIWISDSKITYKNKDLYMLGNSKINGMILIDSKGLIKNIMIEKTQGDISLNNAIRIIKRGILYSPYEIKPTWLKFEII